MSKKYYVNIEDRQGGTWAMGCLYTINGWKKLALDWSSSDENWEVYNYIKKHESDEKLLEYINDIWDIKIVPFTFENLEEIVKSCFSVEKASYWIFYYLLQDCMEKLK